MRTLFRISAFLVSLLLALPVFAAARTFVASTGVDTNPCSLVAPCRGLQAGVNAVDPDGEVVVLDSAGYGTMTITKAVQVIVPPGVHAGITATTGNGVTVNAGVNDVVVLRGLYLHGTPAINSGISFQFGKALHVENCVINGFAIGIFFDSDGQLEVKDTISRENQTGVAVITPFGQAVATLDHVRLERNLVHGLSIGNNARVTLRDSVAADNQNGARVTSSTVAVSAQLTIINSVMANNSNAGVLSGFAGVGPGVVTVTNSTITNNLVGLATQNSGSLQVSNSTIAQNGTGVFPQAGTTLITMGNNMMVSNSLDGAFTGTFLAK
jgi:parallel beta helix pectate lyase-like protein